MQKNAGKSYQGLTIVDETRVREIYDLISSFQSNDDSEHSLLDIPQKIEVTLKSKEKYYPPNCDEIFEIQNKKSDRIEKIDISGGLYGKTFVKVTLGGYYYSQESAEIYASGEAKNVDIAIKKFDDIINREKEIFETIVSINPIFLSIIATIIIQILSGTISKKTIPYLANGESFSTNSIFAYIMLATLLPMFALTYSFNNLIYNYFGRCVFYWSDGKSRYEKYKKISLFIFWTIPLAFIMKIATSNF